MTGHQCSPRGKSWSRMVQPRGSLHAPCNDLAAETHPSLLRCLMLSLSDCSQHGDLLLCHGEGARAAVGLAAKGMQPLGLGPWLLPTRRDAGGAGHLFISIRPSACLCNCFSNFLTEEKVFSVVGEPSGNGATPRRACKCVCTSPAQQEGSCKGGEPNPVLPPQQGAGLDPAEHTAPSANAPLPCASLGGDLGFLTCRKLIAEVC